LCGKAHLDDIDDQQTNGGEDDGWVESNDNDDVRPYLSRPSPLSCYYKQVLADLKPLYDAWCRWDWTVAIFLYTLGPILDKKVLQMFPMASITMLNYLKWVRIDIKMFL
jgi:hypothetical protein